MFTALIVASVLGGPMFDEGGWSIPGGSFWGRGLQMTAVEVTNATWGEEDLTIQAVGYAGPTSAALDWIDDTVLAPGEVYRYELDDAFSVQVIAAGAYYRCDFYEGDNLVATNYANVPEPATLALVVLGAAVVGWGRRR